MGARQGYGHLVAKYRGLKGWTQAGLATKAKYEDKSRINKIEADEKPPGNGIHERLKKAFDDPDGLVGKLGGEFDAEASPLLSARARARGQAPLKLHPLSGRWHIVLKLHLKWFDLPLGQRDRVTVDGYMELFIPMSDKVGFGVAYATVSAELAKPKKHVRIYVLDQLNAVKVVSDKLTFTSKTIHRYPSERDLEGMEYQWTFDKPNGSGIMKGTYAALDRPSDNHGTCTATREAVSDLLGSTIR